MSLPLPRCAYCHLPARCHEITVATATGWRRVLICAACDPQPAAGHPRGRAEVGSGSKIDGEIDTK